MAVITRIAKSRKPFVCQKCHAEIPVGQPYVRGKRNYAKDIIRCTSCGLKPYEVSTSEYIQTVGRIKDRWQEDYGTGDGSWQQIADELDTLRDELQERLDNMPDSLQEGPVGEHLQERIDGLEAALDVLNELEYSDIINSVIEDELDDEDQETLERIKDEHYSGSDYDTWLDEFAKAAMDAHPEESLKWANDHAVLASNLMEHIEEYIIEDVEGALENIEDE